MIAYLWGVLKDTFLSLYCQHCNFKSIFAVRVWRHLHKEHNIRLTKKDWEFLIKHSLITRIIKAILAFPLFVVCFILKIALIPFYHLYELL